MKKIEVFLFLLLFLSGCVTYKFQKGESPYDKGYVVSRSGYTILEYTVRKDNSVPDLKSAKERFKRRKDTVEHYYNKMGYIENSFKQTFLDPPALLVDFMTGIFRLPFIAARDYKYEHSKGYREKVASIEEEQDAYEKARIKDLKEQLNRYLQKDMEEEVRPQKEATTPVGNKQKSVQTEAQLETEGIALKQKEEEIAKMLEEQAKLREKKPEISSHAKGVVAGIIAKPVKGFSPLRVQFYGYKSHSTYGKVVSYYWEFGDGDTSTKPNPVNTYWSISYGSRYFTVTLTVKDDKGNTATSSIIIEVITK